METGEAFIPQNEINHKFFDTPQNHEQKTPMPPNHREICQQLIQEPSSSKLFEKYQLTYNANKKLSSLFELKNAMMARYQVKEPSQATDYELYTGLSDDTSKNFEVLSEYIGLEQAIIVTETNLPDPFTQKPSVEALKKYIILRRGKYLDTSQKIQKYINRHPPDSQEVVTAKNIDKIGGFCDSSRKTVVVSPTVANHKDHLFTLAHETYHFSQKDKHLFSKHKIDLFNQRDFLHEEEFEANLYALLYDPSPLEFGDNNLSESDKLFLTLDTILSLTETSVMNKINQIYRKLDKISPQTTPNSLPNKSSL